VNGIASQSPALQSDKALIEMVDRFDPSGVHLGPAVNPTALPKRLLYATSSGIGGTGLDSTSYEGARASFEQGFLSEIVCFGYQQKVVPRSLIRTLQMHPVRALSCLGSRDYYPAKKRYADWIASRRLRSGDFDFFHGWSGDCFRSLIEARMRGIPSVMDIPTWHRNKGHAKSAETKSERETRLRMGGWKDWRKKLAIPRTQMLAEYDLADVILVASRKAAETFQAAGISDDRLCYVARGVDIERYQPGNPPDIFRLCFVGALIERKGVHHLLEAWKRLNLKDAELLLVGTLHEEMKPYVERFSTPSVKILGFSSSVQDELRRSSAFVFPSECEGSAKVTYEAAACALPQISTRESGDVVVHGENGLIVPPNDPDALAAAIEHFYQNREDLSPMGLRGRERVLQLFTWDHYRLRLLAAYRHAMTCRR
jgi:glycosyltransferase involved in cell wall biosynthesis